MKKNQMKSKTNLNTIDLTQVQSHTGLTMALLYTSFYDRGTDKDLQAYERFMMHTAGICMNHKPLQRAGLS